MVNVKKLVHHGYFILINSILAMLIAIRYLIALETPINSLVSSVVFISNHISHMLSLSIFLGLMALPTLWLSVDIRYRILAVIATVALLLLCIDTEFFIRNHDHLDIFRAISGLFKTVIYAKFVFALLVAIVGAMLLIFFELKLLKWIEQSTWFSYKHVLSNLCLGILLSMFFFHGVYHWFFPVNHVQIDFPSKYLPVFYSDD